MQCQDDRAKLLANDDEMDADQSVKEETQRVQICCYSSSRDLLVFKGFYLLFYAGFGSAFPYLGLYFRQIGLNASNVGILAGVRPLVQFIGGPFWAFIADKYRIRKVILLISIMSWLIMTFLLIFPKPVHITCVPLRDNSSEERNNSVIRTNVSEILSGQKKSMIGLHDTNLLPQIAEVSHVKVKFQKDKAKMPHRIRKRSAISRRASSQEDDDYVIQYNEREVTITFCVLLLLVIFGEFLEAPSFVLSDAALIESLGTEKHHYGKTRMFGSLGYGVASCTMGAVLDHFQYQFCGHSLTDYTIIFYAFAALMTVAFFFALCAVRFSSVISSEPGHMKEIMELLMTSEYGSFLLVCWFMGFSHAGVMTFLNWYLEDIGATKTMMGVATIFRCAAIIFGFYVAGDVVERWGHISIILGSLLSDVFTMMSYSIITNPWLAIPIEAIQGATYSLSWSACITYFGAAAKPNTGASMQGILQGVYAGLGAGLGSISGGLLVHAYGLELTFQVSACLSAVVFILYAGFLRLVKRPGKL